MMRTLALLAAAALAVGPSADLVRYGVPARAARADAPAGTPSTYVVDREAPGRCGDDLPGTSARPWCTIGRAAGSLRPGDTVVVRRGRYRESVTPPSGSPGAWVTYAGEEGAVLDGDGVADPAFDLRDVSYVKVSGFEVTGYQRRRPAGNSVSIRGGSHHVELARLLVHHNWNGIIIQDQAHDIIVSDSEVHHCVYGVGFEDAAHDIRIDRVSSHHNSELNVGPPRHPTYPNGDGFSADAGTSGITITDSRADDNQDGGFDLASRAASCSGCLAHGNRYGFRLWQGEVGTLANCLAFGNTGYPLQLGSNGGAGTKRILGSTFVGTAGDRGFSVEIVGTARLFVRNSIFAGFRSGVFSAPPAALDEDHDLFHAPGVPIGFTIGAHSLAGEPRFVDLEGGDLHLRRDSPAIDRGVALPELATDLDRVPRPQGTAQDLGAYEMPALSVRR